METTFKSGFVTLLGLPNSGKSTLFNKLTESSLAIVTPKAQTTRTLLRGHLVQDDMECVLVDTPGMQEGTKALNQAISRNATKAAANALEGDELVLLVIDAPSIGAQIRDQKTIMPSALSVLDRVLGASFEALTLPIALTVIPVLHKADLVRKAEHREEIESAVLRLCEKLFTNTRQPHWVSSHSGSGISELLSTIRESLPEGTPGELFEAETLTDQSTRDLVAEYIREQCFLQLGDELPYSTAVMIDKFDETDPSIYRIDATIFVERDSQKGMVIGAEARKIKAIGTKARARIEELLGTKVYLALKVKVSAHWARKKDLVERFGYGEAGP